MRVITVTPDRSIGGHAVKMTCSCRQWVEKAYLGDMVGKAERHLRKLHGGKGTIKYLKTTIHVGGTPTNE